MCAAEHERCSANFALRENLQVESFACNVIDNLPFFYSTYGI